MLAPWPRAKNRQFAKAFFGSVEESETSVGTVSLWNPVLGGGPHQDGGPAGRLRATCAVYLAVESQPRAHPGGRPVRARRAHRGTAARMAHPARPPAPSRIADNRYRGSSSDRPEARESSASRSAARDVTLSLGKIWYR